jgi:hypothetical protein
MGAESQPLRFLIVISWRFCRGLARAAFHEMSFWNSQTLFRNRLRRSGLASAVTGSRGKVSIDTLQFVGAQKMIAAKVRSPTATT